MTATSAKAGVNSWTPAVSPTNMAITGMALSPAFPCDRTVFMVTDGFGVYRTTDGDTSDPIWYPINNGLTDLSITSLAISPNFSRCDRINAGDSTVFVGTRGGLLFRSGDGGATWSPTGSGLPDRTTSAGYSVAALAVSPSFASDRTVLAAGQSIASGGSDGVYRSTDAGGTWLPFDAGLTDRSVQAFAMSANFANDATIFLGTRFSGVFRFAGRLSEPSVPPGAPTPTPTPRPTVAPSASPSPGPTASPAPALPGLPGSGSNARRPLTGASDGTTVQGLRFPYPSLRLSISAGGALPGQVTYTVPGPVVLTYTLENNGNEPVTNIRIIDGGAQPFCGDDPLTDKVFEGLDDTQVGTVATLNPGESRTIAATLLVRPASASATADDATFARILRAGCAVGDSVSQGSVATQDNASIQLVVWTSVTRTNSDMTDLWIWSFAVSPFFANDQTVFAGSAYGGLFKSNNAGSPNTTWKRVNAGLEPEWVSVRSIVMSPRFPIDRTVYVGTERGVYKGVEQPDGNMQWSAMNSGLLRPDVRAMGISPNFGSDGIIYAGVWGGDVYRLYNGANPAWVPQRRILNGLWTWAVDLTQDGVLLAGTWGAGPTWPGILGRNVMPAGTGWLYPALPIAPGGELTTITTARTYCNGYSIFVGTWDRGLLKSDDAGATWSTVPIPTNLPIRSISLSANYAHDLTLYVATWGAGVYRSMDGGGGWQQLNAGLTDTRVRAIAMSPNWASDGLVYAGSDTQGVLRWDPSLNRWAPSNSGMPNTRIMALAVSPNFSNDGTIVAGTWGGGVAVSRDRGATWSGSASGLAAAYIRAVQLSPDFATDGTVYLGATNGAYRSGDRGASWSLLGVQGDDMTGVDVTDLVVTPGAPRTIFATTGGHGIWQYTEQSSVSALQGLARLFGQQAPQQQQTGLAGPTFPNDTFVPIVSKGRTGNIC